MGDPESAKAAAQRAQDEAEKMAKIRFPVENDIIGAKWAMGTAMMIEGTDLGRASLHLTEALTRCRRSNLVEREPDILLSWGRWHRANNNMQEAEAYAEEALEIADRCEYRLRQAEIRNFLARLSLDNGDRKAAKEHAEIAAERAWCDGPPYCYQPALTEAQMLLDSISNH